jgi:hypothetical protein
MDLIGVGQIDATWPARLPTALGGSYNNCSITRTADIHGLLTA